MAQTSPIGTAGQSGSKRTPLSVVEAYKAIRANITSLLSKNGGKTFAISSPNPTEGKSTTTINVALAFSQINKKVILLDADWHCPSIHKKLRVNNSDGLLNVLTGFSTLENAIVSYNSNLDILPCGPVPTNPSALFDSSALDSLLRQLEERYDYVIIDTAPINVVSDALVIAPKSDGLVLIARIKQTSHISFKRALEAIQFTNANLLGVIMNGTEMQLNKYNRYSKYGKYDR